MAAILIFAITYLVLAIGRLPGFRIDRTGAAIIGASFMVGVNALSLDEAYRAINFDTIILLFGMMISSNRMSPRCAAACCDLSNSASSNVNVSFIIRES